VSIGSICWLICISQHILPNKACSNVAASGRDPHVIGQVRDWRSGINQDSNSVQLGGRNALPKRLEGQSECPAAKHMSTHPESLDSRERGNEGARDTGQRVVAITTPPLAKI
jgi:hypothetical protein